MLDPVICADGQSYERDNIIAWLDESNTSPVTGLPFPSRALIPNYALRDAIDDWDDAQLQPSQRHPTWNVDELFEAFPAPKLPPFPSAPDGDRKVTLKQLESRYNTAWQQHLQILQQEAVISDALVREYGVLSHTQSFRPSPGASVRPASVAQTRVHVEITAPLPTRNYDAAAISAVAMARMACDIQAQQRGGFVTAPQLIKRDCLGIGVARFLWPQPASLGKRAKRFGGTPLPRNCQRQRVLRFRFLRMRCHGAA
jgi:hypothetical protein